MNEHDDDLEPEVEEGDVEIEEFPIFDDEDEDADAIGDDEDDPDIDPDASEI